MGGQAQDRPAVIGGGVMGSAITAMALGHGVPVTLVEVDGEAVELAKRRVAQQLRHARLMGAFPDVGEGELTATTDLAAAKDATAVVEAIIEDDKVKAAVLGELSALVAPGTPLITNTSGIPVDELAEAVERPADLLATHFMNPAYLIPNVEVVRGPRTGQSTLDAVLGLLERLSRKPIVVRDSPGFVTSRLLHPMINDAARLVEEGTASVEAVDELMQGCLGHPTGPLRTADLIGLDNLADALRALAERTGDPRHAPCALLLSKVADGHLGRKSGRGFYEYGKVF
ncbi:3-hydroxyacyl-CoA dehydrogenase family protein [Amycolatopsis sp. SID8362]|uniref:3-hydroxyacyl-CoA dehydrogenase family protein n=1 Tax=Amycolatopsis sp. SID8362 TaxID=2690346 RepID=UPI00136BF490|nr:3-hydroxyacyl-CoA dehydrogenase family protein [Amycolatopsis sp. SID8362]NBH05257.1 3-hydroxyacyl-CoA dehydrogenase family protein [Amycolatopsis sp. SID8362]NED41957.1 3-hydroxyacyl-CoA dehydrogenase family protein [Amycolatopsis sp. SID8362]